MKICPTSLIALLFAGFVLAITAGCEGEPAGTGAPPPPPPAPATSAATSAPHNPVDLPALDPAEIEVTKVDAASFKSKLKELEGKVVLVDFWATWCSPCVKNFPHTAELARKHEKDGLVMVTVSLDEADSLDDVRRFLATQRARGPGFVNLLSAHGGDESFEKFDIESAAIPYYVVFDRTGKLAARLSPADSTEKFELSSIDAAVEKALAAR